MEAQGFKKPSLSSEGVEVSLSRSHTVRGQSLDSSVLTADAEQDGGREPAISAEERDAMFDRDMSERTGGRSYR